MKEPKRQYGLQMVKNNILYIASIFILIVFGYRLFFNTSIHEWQLDVFGYAYIPLLFFNFLAPSILSFGKANKTGITWTGGFYKGAIRTGILASFIGFLVMAIGFDLCLSNGYSDRTWPGGMIVASFAFLASFAVHFILRKKVVVVIDSMQKNGYRIVMFFALATSIIGIIYHESFPKLVSVLNTIFIVALLEEYLFRGFFQTQLLMISSKGIHIFKTQLPFAVIIQGFLFGIIHVLVNAPPFEWFYGIWTIPMGIVFGIITYKTGNIWLAFFIHAILGSLPILFS